jgi:antibiotic biosynthesis monooxygenase (ABM) superfamily enzyme
MEQRIEYIKAAPPVTISTISLIGIPLNEWVFICTIVYTVLLTIFLVRDKLIYPWLERKRVAAEANNGD